MTAERLLVAAKRLGFSLAEIKTFTVAEIMDLVSVAIPDDKGPSVRDATQEDIDKFIG